jgi:hypothetical protein
VVLLTFAGVCGRVGSGRQRCPISTGPVNPSQPPVHHVSRVIRPSVPGSPRWYDIPFGCPLGTEHDPAQLLCRVRGRRQGPSGEMAPRHSNECSARTPLVAPHWPSTNARPPRQSSVFATSVLAMSYRSHQKQGLRADGWPAKGCTPHGAQTPVHP